MSVFLMCYKVFPTFTNLERLLKNCKISKVKTRKSGNMSFNIKSVNALKQGVPYLTHVKSLLPS